MHADYLNITVPTTQVVPVQSEILSVISSVGAVGSAGGVYRLATGGTFKVDERRGFTLFGASGDALGALRGASLYESYLSPFALVPHNVSLLHIAHDVRGDAPTVLKSLVAHSRGSRGLKLSRKRLNPETQVRTLLSMGRDGRDTGTVYLGTRKAECRAKVYDKSDERFRRAGLEIPPTVRYELEVTGKTGVSLKDAYEPEAIFWHFMSDIFGSAPSGISEWVPGGQGFSIAPGVPSLPAESLRRLLDGSPFLAQCFALADSIGPHGYEYFLRLLHERYGAVTSQPGVASGSGSLPSVGGAAGS